MANIVGQTIPAAGTLMGESPETKNLGVEQSGMSNLRNMNKCTSEATLYHNYINC